MERSTTIWKGIQQGCILSHYLFNLYAEYIMRNARLDESQDRIKVARKISTTSDNTTLMAESRESKGNPLRYSCLENPIYGGAW